MAILKFGPTVVGLRGAIGGIVFSANGSSNYAKAWSRSSNPRTPLQTDQRSRLASLPAAWRSLTDVERTAWATFAALPAQDLINSLGITYSISGFGWYTKINARLLAMGRAVRTPVPTQSRPAAPTITALQFPFGIGQTAFVAYATAEFEPDFDLVLEIAQASSIGRTAAPTTFAEFVVTQNPDDTETGFTVPYVNRLGIGNTSLKGFARLYRQTTDGLRSAAGAAAFVAADAPNYAPGALAYDGINDFALRGADLTGAVDSKVWSESGWIKIDGGDGTNRFFRANAANRWSASINTTNRLNFLGRDSAGATVVAVQSPGTLLAGSGWHSFAFSVDTTTQTATLVIDNVIVSPVISDLVPNTTIDVAVADHSFGARVTADLFWDGCLSNHWVSIAEALDFTDVAVLRSFISRENEPLFLGTTGQLPTGTSPIIYFPDGDASNNTGLGGSYVNQAASAACADSP